MIPHFRKALLPSKLRSWKQDPRVSIRFLAKLPKHPKIVVEEPKSYSNPSIQQYHDEFTTYLTDTKLPNKLKRKLVFSKIEDLIQQPVGTEGINLLSYVLKNITENRSNEPIPLGLAVKIFNNTYNYLLSERPDFLERLMRQLIANGNELPDQTLILWMDFVSRQSVGVENIYHRLEYRMNDEFVDKYFDFLKSNHRLNLGIFESLCKVRVNDSFVYALNEYVESLFGDELPEVHCFEDLEKSLDRVQMLVSDVIEKIDTKKLSVPALFAIFKLNEEFLQVSASSQAEAGRSKLVHGLALRTNEVLDTIKGQIGQDGTLMESLLFAARRYNMKLCNASAKLILSDQKCSSAMKIEAKLMNEILSQQKLEVILKSEEVSEEIFEATIQAVSISHPHLTDVAFDYYRANGLLPSAKVFKAMLDSAISENNFTLAFKIFTDSTSYLQWPDYYDDLAIAKSLNDLIQCVVANTPIRDSFPMFQKIKAQLQQPINIDSINVMSSAMLEANLVGDVLEMLKRELPRIKDEKLRLPIDKPFGHKYLQLFNTLHTYAISNTFDKSVANNWYLFTHLYKYFHIPPDCILPTLKFFCQHERWNGALLIFNKMVDQHQLHGDHSFPPPSPEIYMYLLNEFGDKLYEEGVIQLHDWLKMDTNIPRVGLELTNVIMNAYCNLQDVAKVRDLFIAANVNDKVDEESAIIMIKAYTYNDLHYVEKFWDNLSKFGLVPNYDMYKQYLIAYAYYGKTEKAFELVERIDEYDLNVSEDLLLNLHNYCYIEDKQHEIKEWARTNFPQLWNNVEKSGLLIEATGYKPHEHFLVDGSIEEKPKLIDK
ncbi:hypothetical protein CANMA_004342 [Candida margitis]|uniref:uncharacterized protein n=1 Tax=Candida margitis TaxID=1775924 RepID=UPI0022264C90|nr:uncharacterized protein CANMA_004342 [Candida margitis]KAI5957910.1 hypothetical protein CANMA_004342 [Candida margitis]